MTLKSSLINMQYSLIFNLINNIKKLLRSYNFFFSEMGGKGFYLGFFDTLNGGFSE